MLNDIEINKYFLPYLMGNLHIYTTVTDFIPILKSIDYSKFDRFSNPANEISTKQVSSFIECELLVAVFDGYDFEFSIEGTERKRRTWYSFHMQEIESIDSKNFPKPFQKYFRSSNNKTNLVKQLF